MEYPRVRMGPNTTSHTKGNAQVAKEPKRLIHATIIPGREWPDNIKKEDIIHIEPSRTWDGELELWYLESVTKVRKNEIPQL
jgi:hypothetical protein